MNLLEIRYSYEKKALMYLMDEGIQGKLGIVKGKKALMCLIVEEIQGKLGIVVRRKRRCA